MIGRDFYKRLQLLQGRTETIRTRFELNEAGRLVEHVAVWTDDRSVPGTAGAPLVHRRSNLRRT